MSDISPLATKILAVLEMGERFTVADLCKKPGLPTNTAAYSIRANWTTFPSVLDELIGVNEVQCVGTKKEAGKKGRPARLYRRSPLTWEDCGGK